MKILRNTAIALALGACGSVSAQSVTIGTTTVPVGSTSAVVPVTYTAGNSVVSYQVDFTVTRSPAGAVAASGQVTTANVTGVCSGNAITTATGTALRATDIDIDNNPLPSGVTCNLTIPLDPAAAPGTYPIPVVFSEFNQSGGTVAGTATPGAIIIAAVSSPTVTFAPPNGPAGGAAEITFPAGTSGSTNTQTINIDGTGGTSGESTTVENCVLAGAGFAFNPAFTPTTINSGDAAGDIDGTIGVQCTYLAGSPRTGTLTCDVNPTVGATTQANWDLSCPAGGATPPTVTYNPTAGSTILFTGAAASVQTRTVTVTQATTGQAGTSVTIQNCTATAGFTAPVVTPNPIVINGGSTGQSGTVSTSCTIPATAPDVTGTLTCDEVTNNGVATTTTPRSWNLTCQAPSPEFSSSPQSGGTVNLTGAPTTTVTGSIPVTNVGLADLTVTGCAIAGDPVTFPTVPTSPGTIAPNATVPIAFSCVAPSVAGTTVSGTLTCTTNDTTDGEGTVTFTINCTSLILSIPAMDAGGKALLVLLVLSLGLIGFGVHRRLA